MKYVNDAEKICKRRLAEKHVELLAGSADAPVHFRLIHHHRKGDAKVRYGTLGSLWPEFMAAQSEGYGVFVVVNEGGQSREEITRIRAVFVDADGEPLPAAWHREPDFIVQRDATHWHAYWLVFGMPVGEFMAAQLRLAAHYGTDPSVKDLPRVMRLAGTLHMKGATHYVLELAQVRQDICSSTQPYEVLAGLPPVPTQKNGVRKAAPGVELDRPISIHRAIVFLQERVQSGDVPRQGSRNNETFKVACRIKDWGCSPETTLELLTEYWNPHFQPPLDHDELEQIVGNAFENGQNEPGCNARPSMAEALGKLPAVTGAGTALHLPSADPTSVPFGSQIDASNYIVGLHHSRLRYVHEWKSWLVFDGRRWKKDNLLSVWELVKREAADFAERTFEKEPQKRAFASKPTVAGLEVLMRADPRVAMSASEWDRDPWLLNTPSGVVELRTGQLRQANAFDYFIKSTAVGPGGECPQWRTFLDRITAGDGALVSYIQRIFGYALTGSIREHAMFFGYGTGGNGKGVLLNTLTGILDDYATEAPVETFTASKYDRHPTELARLRGARLVVAHETEQGRRWAEARLKAITGGDRITARYMHQDFFEYTPEFKLFITGNHMPVLSNVDEAMKRRINMIPFTITIPKAERDPDLAERLRSEWPGILAWGIEGCQEWQRDRLKPPTAVLQATDGYFTEQDPFESWLACWCQMDDPNAWTGTRELYDSYCGHALASHKAILSEKQFVERLQGKALEPRERRSPIRTKGFAGIQIVEL